MDLAIRSQEILGSHIEIKVPKSFASVLDACFLELDRIDKTYSRFRTDSIITHLNTHLNSWQIVPEELTNLIAKALELHKKTDGNFDITVKSDLDRLGYDEKYSFTEKKKSFRDMLPKFGNPITLDAKNNKIKLKKQIEIGGFGKGYALDRVSQILNNHNIDYYYINAGGDIKVKGDWDILLEHPDDTTKVIAKIELKDQAIACSAPNRRAWGKHHHLINAKTRLPQRTMKCIFVLAETGIDADGYATALFTAGFEDAIRLSQSAPVRVILVSAENKVYKSPDWPVTFFA